MSFKHFVIGLMLLATACSDKSSQRGLGTYKYSDAQSTLNARCVSCHSPNNIAPFSLETYEDVYEHRFEIEASIQSGSMPPWPPAQDCNSFRYSRAMGEQEKQQLLAWLDAGAPKDSAPPANNEQHHEETAAYNTILKMPEAYTPLKQPDDHRCFIVDWPNQDLSYIVGSQGVPGARPVVHHMVVYAVAPERAHVFRDLDAADAGPGYDCFGGPPTGEPTMLVGAWVPGDMGSSYPDGTGVPVRPGSIIVMDMHYNTSTAGAIPDQTTIQFKTVASVPHPGFNTFYAKMGWVTGNVPMTIPAGAPDTKHTYEVDMSPMLTLFAKDTIEIENNQPFMVHAALGHMHTRGTQISLKVLRANSSASTCMLDIPDWDFHWQGFYFFEKPITVYPGDRILLECHWNNTKSKQPIVNGVRQDPIDLEWGPNTNDEMCLGGMFITPVF